MMFREHCVFVIWGCFFAPLGDCLSLLSRSWLAMVGSCLPCPLHRPRSELTQNSLHPPKLNITQLKNLILAGQFCVKVEISAPARGKYLTLRRPLGDINARGGGGVSLLGASWFDLGRSWQGPGSVFGALGSLLGALGRIWVRASTYWWPGVRIWSPRGRDCRSGERARI